MLLEKRTYCLNSYLLKFHHLICWVITLCIQDCVQEQARGEGSAFGGFRLYFGAAETPLACKVRVMGDLWSPSSLRI